MNLRNPLCRWPWSATLLAMCALGLAQQAAAQAIPLYDHVVIVMMENQSYSTIIGNTSQAPYINSLAAAGASFSDAHGVWHPSLPNYYALLSGSTQGLTNSTPPAPGSIDADNLPNQLITQGLGFADYSDESVPAAWLRFTDLPGTSSAPNPVDIWLSCPATVSGQGCGFPTTSTEYAALPAVTFVHGNASQSMHDNNILAGDAWVQSTFGGYAQWALAHNSLLIVTFDEDDFSTANHIPIVFYGAHVKQGSYSETINHYNVLRTIEDMYGLAALANAASAAPITDVWVTGPVGGTPSAAFSFITSGLTATFTDISTDNGGTIGVHSWTFGDGSTSTSAGPSHTYSVAGTYSVTETVTDSVTGQTSSATKAVTVSSLAGSAKNIVAANSGLCLNVTNNSNGTGVVQSTCGSTGNLEWKLVAVGSYYHIVAQGSGLCLNVPNSSTTAGTQLIQWGCQSSSIYNDQWSLVAVGGNYHIVNRNNGLCVNIGGSSLSAGGKVIQWYCQSSSSLNDQFTFK